LLWVLGVRVVSRVDRLWLVRRLLHITLRIWLVTIPSVWIRHNNTVHRVDKFVNPAARFARAPASSAFFASESVSKRLVSVKGVWTVTLTRHDYCSLLSRAISDSGSKIYPLASHHFLCLPALG
jgi:hypothetical protein